MKEIKEIIVYSNGDSNDIATWSNVPYFFTKELEKRNIKVDRVNINYNYKSSVTAFVYFYLIKVIRTLITLIKGTKPKLKFQYTNYYRRQIEKIMNESIRKYHNADLQLMFGFSYSIKSSIPLVMLSDWTIEYRLLNRQKREPSNYEKKLIAEQYNTLSDAFALVSLMPNSKELIEKRINKNVYYFGTGINSINDYDSNVENKCKSNQILFSGRKKEYLNGLIKLINVINYCNDKYNRNYKINVIGMNKEDVYDADRSNCMFYGYLRKDDKEQSSMYYSLINESKLLMNINEGWNGISTLLEVLYHGTPIIISKNKEVEKIFGVNLECCEYVDDEEEIDSIARKVDKFMQMNIDEYSKVSKLAHEITNGHEWSMIVDKFTKEMESLL